MVHSFIWFEDAKKSLLNIGHVCLFFPLFLCKPYPSFVYRCLIDEQFVWKIKPFFCLSVNLVHCITHPRLPFDQLVGDLDMHSMVCRSHVDSLKFIISYIFLISLEFFFPIIDKNWWTHLENPMALYFLVNNALFLESWIFQMTGISYHLT